MGRHFRSEAGQICIRPLLEEEALQVGQLGSMKHDNTQSANNSAFFDDNPHLQPSTETLLQQPPALGSQLPTSLLASYPALQDVDWDGLPADGPSGPDEFNGRSTFDTSAQGEYHADESGQ